MFAPERFSWLTIGCRRGCFNEAGACLPRKRTSPRMAARRRSRFNEAGACLPRKAAASCAASAAPPRFNEAGACLPRKGDPSRSPRSDGGVLQ